MNKNAVLFFFFMLTTISAICQKITGKLKFEQGKEYAIDLQLKTTIAQQAMGQAIDFTVDASAKHNYKVTNSTEDNTTLRHGIKKINFLFDGMGQKMSFDSDKEKDLNGMFGKTMKELMDKKFDMIIDTSGKVLMAMPEKITLGQGDSRMAIVTSMLREIMDLVQPPQKSTASFFKILPDTAVGKGDKWVTSGSPTAAKFDGAYAISDINDSTIVVDFVEKYVTINKAEMMGSPTTTTLNHKSTGKIILDRATGILLEKTSETESHGNTEASFGTLPVTSKTNTTIKVKRD